MDRSRINCIFRREAEEEEGDEGELADFTEKLCWVCQGTASLQCPQSGWDKQESLKLEAPGSNLLFSHPQTVVCCPALNLT